MYRGGPVPHIQIQHVDLLLDNLLEGHPIRELLGIVMPLVVRFDCQTEFLLGTGPTEWDIDNVHVFLLQLFPGRDSATAYTMRSFLKEVDTVGLIFVFGPLLYSEIGCRLNTGLLGTREELGFAFLVE